MRHHIFLNEYSPLQLKPLFFGSEDCSPGHNRSGFRDHFLLHLIHKGQGIFYCEGKRWELKQGDGFIIFPGTKKIRYVANNIDPWHYVWIAWKDPAGEMPKKFNLSLKNPCIHVPSNFSSDLLSILLSDNSALIKQKNFIMLFTAIMQFLLEKYGVKGREFGEKEKLFHEKRMMEFIHENYASHINVTDVVQYVNLERSYAGRIFKKVWGTGILSYIADVRFRRACDLLMHNYSVKEICHTCGYSDYGNFLKTFKKLSGLSPTEYRQKKRS